MIRIMTMADLDEVMAIEEYVFQEGWNRNSFEYEVNAISSKLWVCEEDGQVIGYCGIHDMIDDCEVSTIAIRPDKQGKGLGKQLFEHMLDYCKTKGFGKMFLEVRESNLRALSLYRKHGFVTNRVRKNYYGNEDGYEMVKEFHD